MNLARLLATIFLPQKVEEVSVKFGVLRQRSSSFPSLCYVLALPDVGTSDGGFTDSDECCPDQA